VQGQLGEKLIPDLIREIAQKKGSGLLRLTRGKVIKAIFFESGTPVFAISNVLNEQLEHRLLEAKRTDAAQIEKAKTTAGKANKLGAALVEMGVLNPEEMRDYTREQIKAIILSLFEWTQADYVFDERIRATHDVTLDAPTADLLLEGARLGAAVTQIAETLAPATGVIVRARVNGTRMDSGRLIPIESYVLSRIDSPTTISDVGSLSGLSDDDARRAVCSLVAAGYLKFVSDKEEEAPAHEVDEALERFRDDVVRKLHFFASADYYEILGVGRQAALADIKAAYYQLAKKFHPDLYRQPEHGDLRAKLEALFAKITQAYDTLSENGPRIGYDEKLKISAKAPAANSYATTPLKTTPLKPPAPSGDLTAKAAAQNAEQKAPADLNSPSFHATVSEPSHSAEAIHKEKTGKPLESAETFYQRGRSLYDKKEYHLAVHLFREAIRLEPGKPQYHFNLGLALLRNPRARREADEHLTKAAELDPYNAQIRAKLGMLYKEAGLAKKAEAYFREALSLDPDNRVAQREVATTKPAAKADAESIWKADLGTIAKRLFKK